jgi:integrase
MSSTGSVQQTGKNSWKLTVSGGFDDSGKRIRYTKTVRSTGGTVWAQEKDARKQLALFISEIERGQAATSGKMTIVQFYEYWKIHYASKNLEASTLAFNDVTFRRIKASLGNLRLDKLEPKHLLSFYTYLQEPGIKTVKGKPTQESLSTNTVKRYHALLSSLFTKAVQWGFIPFNPCGRVEPPKATKKPKDIYSLEYLGKLLQALEKESLKYQAITMLALTGGLRREELFGLEWKHIDFENNTVRIEQASVCVPGEVILKGTKNLSSNRLISISVSVINLLRQYKIEQNTARLELGDQWRKSERIFTTRSGKSMHPVSYNKWLSHFTESNNLPHLSPHTLRHMSATYLIASGTDIRTVSGKLGHAQTSTTMNVYSHLLKSAEQETASTMENFLAQATEKAKKIKQAK